MVTNEGWGIRETRLARLVPFVLAAAVALTYANGLRGGFHFDDWHVIERNTAIRSLANVPRFFVDPDLSSASRDNRTLRPLLLASFALNHAISGLAPWSYHAGNILLHWLVVCLVFRIARDHFRLGRESQPLAILIALVVATHPLATSAVDYVSARSAVMAALFYLLAFDAALRSQTGRALGWFAAALLTKENVITLPLVVLAHQWIDGRRPAWRTIGSLTALAGAAGVYRLLLLPPDVLAATHDASVTPWRYTMTGWSAYLYYGRLFAWPDALTIDRLDFPMVQSLRDVQAWGSLLVLASGVALAIRVRRTMPAVTIAAAWILLTLAAESSFFPLAEAVNEHRPYLALLGFATLTVVGARAVTERVARYLAMPALASTVVAGVAICVALGAVAHERNLVWRSDYALWSEATERAPANPRAWTNAGHAALALGRRDEARALLLQGQQLAPCYLYALLNLSAVDRLDGDAAEALRWADRAVTCHPDATLAYEYRGAALLAAERTEDALAAYQRAATIDPRNQSAWLAVAQLDERAERWSAAADDWERLLALDPSDTVAAMSAGVVRHRRLGDSAGALALFDRVLALDPNHYGAHYQRAVTLLALGRVDEARTAWNTFAPMAERIGDDASLAAAPPALRIATASVAAEVQP